MRTTCVEDQATDRAHRIGQTKKVFVYKLIAQGTTEQRMLEQQERKRIIASSVYDESGGVSPSFGEADLAVCANTGKRLEITQDILHDWVPVR